MTDFMQTDSLTSQTEGTSKIWYEQRTCDRGISSSNFSQGVQAYTVDTRGGISWRGLNKSYFRIRSNLSYVGPTPFAQRQLTLADGVALNMNAPACMWQSMSFEINGQTIENINFPAEVDTFEKRLNSSKANLDSVLSTTCFFQSKIGERMQLTAQDGIENVFGNAGLVIKDSTNNNLQVGSLELKPFNAKSYEFVWMPAFGIVKHQHLLPPSVNFRINLNPYDASSLPIRCVETVSSKVVGVVGSVEGIVFNVSDIQFYVYNRDIRHFTEGVFNLTLDCTDVQPTSIQNTTSINSVYSVNEATYALCLAYTDSRRGVDSRYSCTKFKVNPVVSNNNTTSDELKLLRYSIQYANNKLPVQDPNPSFNQSNTGPTDLSSQTFITQQYYENLIATGLLMQNGGCETLEDYVNRGPYYYQNFPQNGTRATNVQVQSYFSSNVANTTELLFSRYTKQVRIVIQNERVMAVNTL